MPNSSQTTVAISLKLFQYRWIPLFGKVGYGDFDGVEEELEELHMSKRIEGVIQKSKKDSTTLLKSIATELHQTSCQVGHAYLSRTPRP